MKSPLDILVVMLNEAVGHTGLELKGETSEERLFKSDIVTLNKIIKGV